MKRGQDIALASAAIFLFGPLMLLAALLVHLSGPGPILFRQERVGQDGRLFTILKFRTMAGDKRVTRFGALLRSSKLDELPQLFNVLKGDMSLTGPRPELPDYVALWTAEDRTVVLSVKPGITDFASLIFRREESLLADQSDPEDYYRRVLIPQKLRLARFYVRARTCRRDLWLLAETFCALLGLPGRLTGSRQLSQSGLLKLGLAFCGGFLILALLSYLNPGWATVALSVWCVATGIILPELPLGVAVFALSFKQLFYLDSSHTQLVMASAVAVVALQALLDRRTVFIVRHLSRYPLLALLVFSLFLDAAHLFPALDQESLKRLAWHLLSVLAALRAAAMARNTTAMNALKFFLVAAGAIGAVISAIYLYAPMPHLVGNVFIHTEILRLVGVQDDSNSVARWLLPAIMAAIISQDRHPTKLSWAALVGLCILLESTASKSGLIWLMTGMLALPVLTGRWRHAGHSLLAVATASIVWFGALEIPVKHHAARWWYSSGISSDGAVIVSYDIYVRQNSFFKHLNKYAPHAFFGDLLTSLRLRTQSTPMVIDAKPVERPAPAPATPLTVLSGQMPDGESFKTARNWTHIRDKRKDEPAIQPALPIGTTQKIQDKKEAPPPELAILESGSRLSLWRAGIDVIRLHPWWGIGVTGWPKQFLKRLGFPHISPHNGFLHVTGSYGILGAALYLAALARIGWMILKVRSDLWTLSVVALSFAFELFDVSCVFTPTLIGTAICIMIGRLEGASLPPQAGGWNDNAEGRHALDGHICDLKRGGVKSMHDAQDAADTPPCQSSAT